MAWWVAIGFVAGSACFALGGWAVCWPADLLAALRPAAVANRIFFAGSLFFTLAAYLQLLEAANGDVAEALAGPRREWRWLGWRPRNIGWLACLVQLAGTLAFNFDTGDALIAGLGWEEADVLVWTPNVLGCVCFLASSLLAWVELSHASGWLAPRSVSWWSVVMNATGSAAFAVAAGDSFLRPGPPDVERLWLAGWFTVVGSMCFLVGSYLLIPELFDGEGRESAPHTSTNGAVIASA